MILVAEVEHPDGHIETIEVMAPNQLEAAELIRQILDGEPAQDFKIKDPRNVDG